MTPQEQIAAVFAAQGIHGKNLATIADNIIYLLEQNNMVDALSLLTTYRTYGSSDILVDTEITPLRPQG